MKSTCYTHTLLCCVVYSLCNKELALNVNELSYFITKRHVYILLHERLAIFLLVCAFFLRQNILYSYKRFMPSVCLTLNVLQLTRPSISFYKIDIQKQYSPPTSELAELPFMLSCLACLWAT